MKFEPLQQSRWRMVEVNYDVMDEEKQPHSVLLKFKYRAAFTHKLKAVCWHSMQRWSLDGFLTPLFGLSLSLNKLFHMGFAYEVQVFCLWGCNKTVTSIIRLCTIDAMIYFSFSEIATAYMISHGSRLWSKKFAYGVATKRWQIKFIHGTTIDAMVSYFSFVETVSPILHRRLSCKNH